MCTSCARWTWTANGRCGRLVAAVLVLWLSVRTAADDGRDQLLRRIDALWMQRDAHGAVPDMVALGTLVLAIDPQSYDAQWRLARAYFWIAYTQPTRQDRDERAADVRGAGRSRSRGLRVFPS